MFCTGDHYLYFFRQGFIRLAVDNFDPKNTNLNAHATHTDHAKKRAKDDKEEKELIN